jgi:hypothetical protein
MSCPTERCLLLCGLNRYEGGTSFVGESGVLQPHGSGVCYYPGLGRFEVRPCRRALETRCQLRYVFCRVHGTKATTKMLVYTQQHQERCTWVNGLGV